MSTFISISKANCTTTSYSRVYRFLHWGMAFLVLAAIALIELKDFMSDRSLRYDIGFLHIQAGLLVFFLIWARVLWRMSNRVPPICPPLTPKHKMAASFTHFALYFMMVATPLLGILSLQSKGKAVALFGLSLPAFVDEDQWLSYALSIKNYHELLGNILIGLIALHVASAIMHHVLRRDDTLRRMLPWLK